jgi:hypothetical protein
LKEACYENDGDDVIYEIICLSDINIEKIIWDIMIYDWAFTNCSVCESENNVSVL